MRIPARLVAVLLAIWLVVPVVASAHEKGWEVLFSTIKASDEGGTETFRGSIFTETSFHPKEACIPDRPVRLYEVVPGADRLLASGKTDKFGAWSFSVPASEPERKLAVKLLRKVVRKDAR